jgi:hypothetical protein
MRRSGSNELEVTTPSEREIVMTRVLVAPRDLVLRGPHLVPAHVELVGTAEVNLRGPKSRICGLRVWSRIAGQTVATALMCAFVPALGVSLGLGVWTLLTRRSEAVRANWATTR